MTRRCLYCYDQLGEETSDPEDIKDSYHDLIRKRAGQIYADTSE